MTKTMIKRLHLSARLIWAVLLISSSVALSAATVHGLFQRDECIYYPWDHHQVPEFTVNGSDGQTYSLSKQTGVVLVSILQETDDAEMTSTLTSLAAADKNPKLAVFTVVELRSDRKVAHFQTLANKAKYSSPLLTADPGVCDEFREQLNDTLKGTNADYRQSLYLVFDANRNVRYCCGRLPDIDDAIKEAQNVVGEDPQANIISTDAANILQEVQNQNSKGQDIDMPQIKARKEQVGPDNKPLFDETRISQKSVLFFFSTQSTDTYKPIYFGLVCKDDPKIKSQAAEKESLGRGEPFYERTTYKVSNGSSPYDFVVYSERDSHEAKGFLRTLSFLVQQTNNSRAHGAN